MKTYIVYDPRGDEVGYIKARGHNEAEAKAIRIYGAGSSVCYTEL